MIRHTSFLLSLAFVCAAHAAQGQTKATATPSAESPRARELRAKAEEVDRVAETEFDRGRESAEQRAARVEFENEMRVRFNPLRFEDKTMLAPPQDDAARHAAFLAQPDTGLVRLLPREKYEKALAVRGGGAYYSFAHLVHEYRQGSDIELDGGHFSVGFAGADYGFLFDLGDMALEDVTTDTGPIRFLASFTPPSSEPEARKIQRQFHAGYQDGWFVYRRRVPAVAGHAYVVRSVSYGMSDVLVAFRVLREDEHGGVVILWKMLKRFPATRLERLAATR